MAPRTSIIVAAAILVAPCSSAPPVDVRASLVEHLPDHLVSGDERRARVQLHLDGIGFIDELHPW